MTSSDENPLEELNQVIFSLDGQSNETDSRLIEVGRLAEDKSEGACLLKSGLA